MVHTALNMPHARNTPGGSQAPTWNQVRGVRVVSLRLRLRLRHQRGQPPSDHGRHLRLRRRAHSARRIATRQEDGHRQRQLGRRSPSVGLGLLGGRVGAASGGLGLGAGVYCLELLPLSACWQSRRVGAIVVPTEDSRGFRLPPKTRCYNVQLQRDTTI